MICTFTLNVRIPRSSDVAETDLRYRIRAALYDAALAHGAESVVITEPGSAAVEFTTTGGTVVAILKGFDRYRAAGHGENLPEALEALAKVVGAAAASDVNGGRP